MYVPIIYIITIHSTTTERTPRPASATAYDATTTVCPFESFARSVGRTCRFRRSEYRKLPTYIVRHLSHVPFSSMRTCVRYNTVSVRTVRALGLFNVRNDRIFEKKYFTRGFFTVSIRNQPIITLVLTEVTECLQSPQNNRYLTRTESNSKPLMSHFRLFTQSIFQKPK